MKTTAKKNQQVGLLSRSEQLASDGQPVSKLGIDLARRRFNRALDTQQVLALLRTEATRFFELAEVVGKWVWITFSERQPVEVTRSLVELGFHWNARRKAWQHPCGAVRAERPAFDPRKRYECHFPANLKLV